ncbi:MAG: hypothetical protein NTV49_09400 [Kiritimatiellaeota bacterium]|nr:hypothetical protein [Kiritimatiellota bacterium]
MRLLNSTRWGWIICLGVLVGTPGTRAQAPGSGANLGVSREITIATRVGGPERFPPTGPGPHPFFSVGLRWQPDADWFDDSRVETSRATLTGGLRFRLGQAALGSVAVDDELSRYRFDGRADSAFLGLPRTTRITRLTAGGTVPLNPQWSLFAAGDVGWALVNSATAADGCTGGGMLSARRQCTTNFAFTVGLFVHTRLEANARVLPIPGLEWQITDRLGLRTAQGLMLTYRLDERRRWQVDGSLMVENREYRLPADSPTSAGIFRDRGVPLLIGLRYAPNPGMFIYVFGGDYVWQEFRITDRPGLSDLTASFNLAPLFGVNAGLRF